VPQLPQFCASVLVSTQALPHCVCPLVQPEAEQLPLLQEAPAAHWLAQVPQFLASFCRLTQESPHVVSPLVSHSSWSRHAAGAINSRTTNAIRERASFMMVRSLV
jgi:hypothetical protein